MSSAFPSRSTPILVFDPEDTFQRSRGVNGKHPRPMGLVRLFLVARTEASEKKPRQLARPMELQLVPNGSGFLLFFGTVIAPDGKTSRVTADRWPWTIRVQSAYYQPLELTPTELPAAFGGKGDLSTHGLIKLDLQPGPAYPFPEDPIPYAPVILRGTVRHPNGEGWAGVHVFAIASGKEAQTNPAITSADGQWVLALPSAVATGSLQIRFTMPDGTRSEVGPVSVRAGQDNNVSQPALRGEVRQRNRAVQGAAITVEKTAGKTLTDANGNWFFYFGMNQAAGTRKVTATLPGSSKSQSIVASVQPLATVVVPRFDF